MRNLILNQIPTMKLRKVHYNCDTTGENVEKVLEYVKEELMKNDYVSINLHRHKDGLDVEVNIV